MHFKKKRQHSKMRCGICAGQRRRFGAGNEKMRATLKAMCDSARKEDIKHDKLLAEMLQNGMSIQYAK